MAVKIRLKQTGKRNARYFRIVAVDESKKRDGRVIEELGIGGLKKSAQFTIKQDRLDHWLKLGAQLTTGASRILQKT